MMEAVEVCAMRSVRSKSIFDMCWLSLNDQDVWFVVLRNEQGNPEFAMEVKRDGKGMTSTPWRKYALVF